MEATTSSQECCRAPRRSPAAILEGLRPHFPPCELQAIAAWASCFFPYQLEWLFDFGSASLLVKSRRIGGTFTYAGQAALWAMLGEKTHVISRTIDDSKEFIFLAEGHLGVLASLGSKWAGPPATRMRRLYGKRLWVQGGGSITAHAASVGGRGRGGNIILDEFGNHPNPEGTWNAAVPARMLGSSKLRVLGTPNGAQGLFYRLSQDPHYRRFETTLAQARVQGLVVTEEAIREIDIGDPSLHRQFFCCSFDDASEQYVPSELIRACTVEEPRSDRSWAAYAGLDIGRTADLTALVVVQVDHHGIAHVVHVETLKRTSSTDIQRLASRAMNEFGARRLCVDATGLGSFPAEELARRYPTRVEPINFTLNSKEDLATGLYNRFSMGAVKLPASERDLAGDVASLRRIITSANNVRYDAAQTSKGHADRAWALALALHGCSKPASERHEIGPTSPDVQRAPSSGGRVVYR